MPSVEEASYGPAAQEAAAQEEVPESPPKDPAPPRCARKAKAAGPEKTKTVEPDCRDKGSKAEAEPWTMEPPFGSGHRAPRPQPEVVYDPPGSPPGTPRRSRSPRPAPPPSSGETPPKLSRTSARWLYESGRKAGLEEGRKLEKDRQKEQIKLQKRRLRRRFSVLDDDENDDDDEEEEERG